MNIIVVSGHLAKARTITLGVKHIAGMAAAISGTLSSLVALSIGAWIGQQYDGTVLPLVYGYLGMAILAFLTSEFAEIMKLRGVKKPRLVG